MFEHKDTVNDSTACQKPDSPSRPVEADVSPQTIEILLERIKNCMPENPYPKDIFPMEIEDYVRAIPDDMLRSAISGCLGRWAWDVAYDMIWRNIESEFGIELAG